MRHSRAFSLLVAASLAATVLGRSANAQADEVSPTGKGIAGGALLGGELVMGVEAAFGVQPAWAYLLGGALGAGAGAYGGYLVEQNASPKVSLYMLAAGMALVIPTTVAVLEATAYDPPAEYREDRPTVPFPAAEPPRATLPEPTGLVDVSGDGSLRLSVPAVEIRPVFTLTELHRFGLEQRDGVHLPVVSGVF